VANVHLQDVVGALLASLEGAQTASDARTVLVAEQYRQHEILKHFPVPRMALAEVTFNLPFAVATAEPATIDLTAPHNEELSTHVARRLDTLLDHPSLRAFVRPVSDALGQAGNDIAVAVSDALPLGVVSPVEEVARVVADAVHEYLTTKVEPSVPRRFRRDARRQVRAAVDAQVPGLVNEFAATSASGSPGAIGIIVDADELKHYRPASIARATLKLVRRDQEWVAAPSVSSDEPSLRAR
jgi:hypothetical protein